MKLRKFLTLFLLSTGAFFVLSNQNVKAQPGGTFCQSTYNWGIDDCATAYVTCCTPKTNSWPEYVRCCSSADANRSACYSANAWQSWLQEFDYNITDDFFVILNEPSPYCGNYPDMLVGCGSLPTAEEIESCVLMVQQEQAKFHCP
jgi:hypothetical protein